MNNNWIINLVYVNVPTVSVSGTFVDLGREWVYDNVVNRFSVMKAYQILEAITQRLECKA